MSFSKDIILEAFDAIRMNDINRLQSTLSEYSAFEWSKVRNMMSGDTFIHVAARDGNENVLRFILNKLGSSISDLPCVINQKNYEGKTALHEATQASHPEITRLLLDVGASANALKRGDWTPLMLACTKTGCDAIKTVGVLTCPKYFVDPTLKNKDGWSALHIAAREGEHSIVELVLNFSKFSLVHVASNNGRFPVHVAAYHGHLNVTELLLKYERCNVNALDSCGVSPFLDAARGNHIDTVMLLVKAGANVLQTDNMGLGCIHLAAHHGAMKVLIYLVQTLGIDVNWQSERERLSPLHCAARANRPMVVVQLLRLGADPTVIDARNNSVIDRATGSCRTEIKEILEKFQD